jgi:hypothetical protein
MNLRVLLQVFTRIGFKRAASSFFAIFGSLWLLIEPLAIFFPDRFDYGIHGYTALVLFSLFLSIPWWFPRMEGYLSSPDSKIKIKVGDLFDEQGHLVIGTNDVFDTALGEIIKQHSIQGQFLARIYSGDLRKLDQDIEEALRPFADSRKEDLQKTVGKRWRYPVGTTITLGSIKPRYFLIAYGQMGADLVCGSDADSIWLTLSCLWAEFRQKGQGENLSIPVVGSDLARTGIPRMTLIKMIIISFITASKKKFVSRQLTIVINPTDLESVNLYEIGNFIKATCY